MTNLVRNDKEFMRYINSIKKDQSKSKKRKLKEQEDNRNNNNDLNQLFLPLINLSKELRKKEDKKNKEQNILIINETEAKEDHHQEYQESSFDNYHRNNTDKLFMIKKLIQELSKLKAN